MRSTAKHEENSWPKAVFRKWLNKNNNNEESDDSADEGDNDSDYDDDNDGDSPTENAPCKLRRRNSETLRAQYIDTKELRVCIGTWNVGGKLPNDDLDIDEWLDMQGPADIYVLGFQEIVPLNAGNIFGAKDNRPVTTWERIIRDTLNRIRPAKPKYKSYSDPPSPSRFNPSNEAHTTMEELLPETDSDTDDEVHPLDQEESFSSPTDSAQYTAEAEDDSKCDLASAHNSDADTIASQDHDVKRHSSMRRLDRCRGFSSINYEANPETTTTQQKKLMKTLSSSERIGLVWPEQSLDLLAKCAVESQNTFKQVKSFRDYNSFKTVREDFKDFSEIKFPVCNLEAMVSRRRRSAYARIISKQMVGIFLSVWVRRSLRKYIQNLKVSTVGVGIMGYIGNKGSVSVSMSIYQTPLCFICTHLSSGEKHGDEIRRNADVQEIHRRTRFTTAPGTGLPHTIFDHDRIFWFGDLNYRLNLPYERAHELIIAKKWTELVESDQLNRELRKRRAFDGWTEGVIRFPPTYKYEFNSEKYIGDDLKGGRRTPAWCDRILSFGTGIKLLNYRRSELKLSDHRPVTATFMTEVEVFSHKKLLRALTLTNAEVEDGEIISNIDTAVRMGRLKLGEEISDW